MPIVYSCDILLAQRYVAAVLKFTFIDRLGECHLSRYRGSRGDRRTHSRPAATRPIPKVNNDVEIPNQNLTSANVGNRAVAKSCHTKRPRVLVDVVQKAAASLKFESRVEFLPTMYVLNAAGLTKPHAIQHLSVDLTGYDVDVAVITETHLKKKHADHNFTVNDYTLFRRDRVGRRGGGVAVYVNRRLSADVWTCPGDVSQFELLWIRVQTQWRTVFVGALYHPPKPLYESTELLDHIEAGVDALTTAYPAATVVLAGDFNTLDDSEIVTRTAMHSIVNRPTRGVNILDRVYVNDLCYAAVRVVASTVRSDHKAVVAYIGPQLLQLNISRYRRAFRRRNPTQHAMF